MWDTSTKTIVREIKDFVGGVQILSPQGVAIDPSGQMLYIADTGNKRIIRVNLDGTGGTVVSAGQDTPQGAFAAPEWVHFGPDGLMYVSDGGSNIHVFKLTS